jgi:DNA polymerase-3 subunit gamma/tau
VAAVAPSAPAAQSGETDWHRIVAALSITGLARELAQNCELRQLVDGMCLLRLSPKQTHLQMKPNPERLQQALAEYLGQPVQLRIELGENEVDTPAATAGRQRQEQQDRAANAIAQDVFVRDVIDSFGASVVESSIKPIV